VKLVGLRVTNYWGGDALLYVARSSSVRVEGATVFAKPSRVARVRFERSANVRLTGSDVSRCGDRMNCIQMPYSVNVGIAGNTFHDCYGCDFLAVRHVADVSIRRNTFDRALPNDCPTGVCWHPDLVQVYGGRKILIESNRFGISSHGAAQLYISGQYPTDGVTVRSNVFLRSDPVGAITSPTGIIVGNPTGHPGIPLNVVVAGNTILSGTARLTHGHWKLVANGLIVSERFLEIPVEQRPIVVNNLIAAVSHPELLCTNAQVGYNHVTPAPCSELDSSGDAMVDPDGFPQEGSPLIGQAEPSWASTHDHDGFPRDHAPDIGAFEWRDGR
jgi:hypothetical protein